MITPQDLQEAIAYYNGKLDPGQQDAITLAACQYLEDRNKILHILDTLKSNMVKTGMQVYTAEPPEQHYSYSGADTVGDYGDSEFLQAIRGKDAAEMWSIMDTAMKTMQVISRKTYDGIMDMILQ